MSTKIYNGFVLDTADIGDALQIVRDFRPWVEAQQLQVFEDWCERINRERGREKSHPDYYKGCFGLWYDARAVLKKTGLRNVNVDTDFEVIFFPYDGKLYGITYVERYKWHEEWLKQPGISDFSYWDNTDQPDDIDDATWHTREVIWDAILPGVGIPSMNGFSIQISAPNGPNLFNHVRVAASL